MNIPIGSAIGTNMDAGKADFKKLLSKLGGMKMNGYMALDVMTINGIEEGILVFEGGKITGAEYTYFNKEQVVMGDDALPLVLNAASSNGIFDLYELTSKDMQLVRSLNQDSLLKKVPDEHDLQLMIPESFIEKTVESKKQFIIEKQVGVKPAKGEPVKRDDVFKKYNIRKPDQNKLEDMIKTVIEE